jgi:hypothetical protein
LCPSRGWLSSPHEDWIVQGGELHVRGCCRCRPDPRIVPNLVTRLPVYFPKIRPVEVEYTDTRLLTVDGREASPLQLRPEALDVVLTSTWRRNDSGFEAALQVAIRNDGKEPVWLPNDLSLENLVLRVERNGRDIVTPQTARYVQRSSRLDGGATRTWQVAIDRDALGMSQPGPYDVSLVGIEMSSLVEPFASCRIVLER